jgi:Crp-like helix-turn-helix domain
MSGLLTQEFLSQILGVQRSSVTLMTRKLQESGLTNYSRGRIRILDVEALRDSCCECYRAINDHFERLVGWRPGMITEQPTTRTTDWAGAAFRVLCRAAGPVLSDRTTQPQAWRFKQWLGTRVDPGGGGARRVEAVRL